MIKMKRGYWKGKHLHKETKKKLSLKIRQLWKQGRYDFRKGMSLSKSHIKNISEGLKRHYKKHPEMPEIAWTESRKKRHARRMKEYWSKNPEIMQRIRKTRAETLKKHPEIAGKISKSLRKRYATNPKIKLLISKRMKERYKNHPRLRKKLSRIKQLYYEQNPEARRHLLEYWNKKERKVRAMHNMVVKSEGERIIANMLYKNNIKPNYEAVELNFPEMDPVPDFFPQGIWKGKRIASIFLEFYGGHPKSWKTKVEKNILYKKYHVPVMIITPAELKEANHDNLLREMARLSKSNLAKNFKLEKWKLDRTGKTSGEKDKNIKSKKTE